MNTSRIFAIALAFGLVGTAVSETKAQPFWNYASPWGFHPFDGSAYRSGRIPTPPYFSIHPPVYYGRRVSMTYGDSPLIHPVTVSRRVNSAHVPIPAVIINPYVAGPPSIETETEIHTPNEVEANPDNSIVVHVHSPSQANVPPDKPLKKTLADLREDLRNAQASIERLAAQASKLDKAGAQADARVDRLEKRIHSLVRKR